MKKLQLNYIKLFRISQNYKKKIGVNVNTVPVLDVLRNNTNKIIGNRSFSKRK